MCQLILINTNDKDINTALLLSQLLIDTETSHQNGFGVFSNGRDLNKTKETPHHFEDLGITLKKEIKNKKPILAHVRQASTNQEISNEKAHPFESAHFILAHNGTLELSKEYSENHPKQVEALEKSKLIDSEIFLMHLEFAYEDEKHDFVKAINKAMKDFSGKFAFLIFEKELGKYYAVRGNTADLHFAKILSGPEKELIGYVINTEEKSLRNGLDVSCDYLGLITIYELPLGL